MECSQNGPLTSRATRRALEHGYRNFALAIRLGNHGLECMLQLVDDNDIQHEFATLCFTRQPLDHEAGDGAAVAPQAARDICRVLAVHVPLLRERKFSLGQLGPRHHSGCYQR